MKTIKPTVLKSWFILILAGYLCLFLTWYELPKKDSLAYFLDVGQGDATLIKSKGSAFVLIDGGPKNNILKKLPAVIPYFKPEIELIVLSHPHADHMDGLIEVLKRFKVKNALITGVNFSSVQYFYFLSLLEERSANVYIAKADMDFRIGEMIIDVLFPIKTIAGESFENVNNSSIVLRVLVGKNSLLFTGDMELEQEEELLTNKVVLQSDILKVGHHGSKTSSSLDFLSLVKPKVAIISCGKENSYNHPHIETLINLKKAGIKELKRTDLSGDIILELDSCYFCPEGS